MARVNQAQLQKNLNEIGYPVSKTDLIKHAEHKGADEGVLRAFKQLPSKQFETAADVSNAIGDIN